MTTTSTTTLQSIFDAVARHFLAMPRPATNVYGDCVYRTEGGNRCFVGALIKDELYDPVVEGLTIRSDLCDASAILNEVVLASLERFGVQPDDDAPYRFPHDVKYMLYRLQSVHDDWANSSSADYARKGLIDVAGELGLSAAVLEREDA